MRPLGAENAPTPPLARWRVVPAREQLVPFGAAEPAPGDGAGLVVPGAGSDVPAVPTAVVEDRVDVVAVGREECGGFGVLRARQRRADRSAAREVPQPDLAVYRGRHDRAVVRTGVHAGDGAAGNRECRPEGLPIARREDADAAVAAARHQQATVT